MLDKGVSKCAIGNRGYEYCESFCIYRTQYDYWLYPGHVIPRRGMQ